MSKYVVVLIIKLVILIQSITCADECFHKRSRERGICVSISDCENVEEELRNNVPPQICSGKRGLTVCCPQHSLGSRFIQGNKVSISEEKCKIYSRGKQLTSRFDESTGERISGGTKVKFGEFPHFASLGNDDEKDWFCGGSLISDRFVLTAAHCTGKKNPTIVMLGTILRNSDQGRIYKVKKIYNYPGYDDSLKHNDIALIELSRPVEFSSNIRPACLPKNKDQGLQYPNGSYRKLNVIGLGEVGDMTTSDVLLKAVVEHFDIDECASKFRNRKLKEDVQICYGSRSSFKDSCNGDSGGPLNFYDNDISLHRIIGVVSFGLVECGTKGVPGVYTKVSAFVPWIEGIVWK